MPAQEIHIKLIPAAHGVSISLDPVDGDRLVGAWTDLEDMIDRAQNAARRGELLRRDESKLFCLQHGHNPHACELPRGVYGEVSRRIISDKYRPHVSFCAIHRNAQHDQRIKAMILNLGATPQDCSRRVAMLQDFIYVVSVRAETLVGVLYKLRTHRNILVASV